MKADNRKTGVTDRATGSRWAVRVFVLMAFALTLWLCGPRAAEVLAARYRQVTADSPLVDLDQVGFVSEPDWVSGELLVAIAADIGPSLQRRVPILDAAQAAALRDRLIRSPWVRHVELERDFPDRFLLGLDLRRPILAVLDGDGRALCLVDRDAIALPFVVTPLPVVRLFREGGSPTMRFTAGARAEDPRVIAAAAVAVEWRDALAPAIVDCPRLLEVDTTNLGERWMRGRGYPEVRVKLARDDGEPVIFAYGRPVESTLPRVAIATKANVLRKILAHKPALGGLIAGDLRFQNRWADYLQPRAADLPDPDGPWSDLEQRFK